MVLLDYLNGQFGQSSERDLPCLLSCSRFFAPLLLQPFGNDQRLGVLDEGQLREGESAPRRLAHHNYKKERKKERKKRKYMFERSVCRNTVCRNTMGYYIYKADREIRLEKRKMKFLFGMYVASTKHRPS